MLPDFEKDDYMKAGQSFTKKDFETFHKELCEKNGNDYVEASPDDDSNDVDDDFACANNSTLSGFTKAEIMYMKENNVLEVPHNFPRKLVETKHKIQKIIFGAFELRTTFPHNIVLLTNGTIMYCTKFFESTSEGNPPSPSASSKTIGVDGFIFDRVLIYKYIFIKFWNAFPSLLLLLYHYYGYTYR